MKSITEEVRSKKWFGFSGEPITNIVNIGMGGSDLGPRLCINALKDYSSKELKYFFISDADPESFKRVIECIDPATTLFIVSSKSFTTKETLMNAQKAMGLYADKSDLDKHFIAVTAKERYGSDGLGSVG